MPSELIQRQKNDFFRDMTSLGSLFFYILLMLLFLLLKDYGMLNRMLIGLAIIYPVTIFFRTFMFKNRPKKIKYGTYIEKLDASSFPSLHAARTAFMAAILINFFNNPVISLLLVLLALAIAYSRIYLKKHDLKDVLAGIFLGVLVYYFVSYLV